MLNWGDIDTHGFVALSRLRGLVGHAESVLMDRPTLLAHQDQWVVEDVPAATLPSHLTANETELFTDLVENVRGRSVRLEQEPIGLNALRTALTAAGLTVDG